MLKRTNPIFVDVHADDIVTGVDEGGGERESGVTEPDYADGCITMDH